MRGVLSRGHSPGGAFLPSSHMQSFGFALRFKGDAIVAVDPTGTKFQVHAGDGRVVEVGPSLMLGND